MGWKNRCEKFDKEEESWGDFGYSLLSVEEMLYEFVSGDNSHPKSKEIKEFLISIIDDLRVEGYTPYTSNVLHDIEEEKGRVLFIIAKSWLLLFHFLALRIERPLGS